MTHGHPYAWLLILLVLGFQVFVSYRVWRCAVFDRKQKSAQTKLIWLLPFVGATIVFAVLIEEDRLGPPPGNLPTER